MAKELFKYASSEHIQEMRVWYSQDLPCFAGHSWEHIVEVVDEAQYICEKLNIPYTKEVEYGCMLHDMGLINGRKDHHEHGSYMAYKKYVDWFPGEHQSAMEVAWLVKNHRASLLEKSDVLVALSKPENINCLIVNLADRRISRLTADEYFKDNARRSLEYHLKRGESPAEAFESVEDHFREKFGINGYAYLNPLINQVRGDSLGEYIQSKLDSPITFESEVCKALAGETILGLELIGEEISK